MDALGDVFSTGAVGIITDLVSILVLLVVMFTMQWQLALMLLTLLLPVTWLIIYFQQQYRKANYKARGAFVGTQCLAAGKILLASMWFSCFGEKRFNAELFRETNQKYVGAPLIKPSFTTPLCLPTLEWKSLWWPLAGVLWLGGILVLQEP